MTPQALRLLLVEDAEDDALLLVRELREGGFEPDFTRVETPEELKAALENGPWDAIFADYLLPAFTGLDALRIVQEMGADLPFILVSGMIGEETAVEALKAGAHDYLLKGQYARLVPALERAQRDVALQRERRQTAAELTRHREHLEELVQERTQQLAGANQKLLAAHARIDTILEQMRDGFASFDPDWRCTQLNAAAAEMWRIPPEQLLGKTIWEIWPQAFDQPMGVNFRRSLQENIPLKFELYYPAPLDRWFECRCHPTTEGLATFFSDITERRRAAHELQEVITEQKIILGNIGAGVLFVKNRIIVWANPAMTKIFGYATDEMLGETTELLSPDQESYLNAGDEASAAFARDESYSFQAQMKRKDGELRWINLVGQGLSPGHPEEGLIWMLEDITAQKQLEVESLKARNLESLGILAGGIAHDFNNLFQVLLGNISLAKMHIPKESEAFGFLTSAEKAYQQGAKLTSRLITFSSGGFSSKEEIQPAELIKKAVLANAAGATGLELEFDLADDLGMVAVDVGQLEQVMQHLTMNALEAMPTGGRLRVSATTETIAPAAAVPLAPGKYLKISFKDNGRGISKKILPRIFDPYFSTKPFGAEKGMGLGLSLCDTIIKKHGGAITVESSPGAGATFQVYLPSL